MDATGKKPRFSFKTLDAFSEVRETVTAELERRCSWHEAENGETLASAGDHPSRVLFLLHGEVSFHLYTRAGRFVPLATLDHPSLIDATALVEDAALPYSIAAVQPSLVASVGARAFADLVERDHALMGVVLAMTVERQRSLVRHIVEISTMNVRTRIRNELARVCSHRSPDGRSGIISPVPTQAEMANRIGTQREVVSRELSHLQHIGLVIRRGDSLLVTDIAALVEPVD